jgi:hypothetical protein
MENSSFPENEMHTTAFWITLERTLLDVAAVRAVRPPEREFSGCSTRWNRWRRCC